MQGPHHLRAALHTSLIIAGCDLSIFEGKLEVIRVRSSTKYGYFVCFEIYPPGYNIQSIVNGPK